MVNKKKEEICKQFISIILLRYEENKQLRYYFIHFFYYWFVISHELQTNLDNFTQYQMRNVKTNKIHLVMCVLSDAQYINEQSNEYEL